MNASQSLYKPDEYGLIAASYRTSSAYDMARRLAKADRQTLDEQFTEFKALYGVTLNVHLSPNHNKDKIVFVLDCLSTGKEFILYSDQKNYTIFVPRSMCAIHYSGGIEETREIADTEKNWQECIKLGMITYDHFFTNNTQIDGKAAQVLQLQQGDRE